eukprot:3868930-Pleurochrysis_carterae.AAC.2
MESVIPIPERRALEDVYLEKRLAVLDFMKTVALERETAESTPRAHLKSPTTCAHFSRRCECAMRLTMSSYTSQYDAIIMYMRTLWEQGQLLARALVVQSIDDAFKHGASTKDLGADHFPELAVITQFISVSHHFIPVRTKRPIESNAT